MIQNLNLETESCVRKTRYLEVSCLDVAMNMNREPSRINKAHYDHTTGATVHSDSGGVEARLGLHFQSGNELHRIDGS
jgi:hypothetical protein